MADTFTSSDFTAAIESGTESAASTPASTTPEPVAAPASPEPAASTAPDATVPAAPSVPVRKRGPIPIDEHEKVIANTREKTRTEARAEWEKENAPYQWAKTVDPSQTQAALRIAQRAQTDPVGLLNDMIVHAQQNPQHAGQIRSLAARLLGQRVPTQQDEDPEPQPDIPTDTSNGVPQVFSVARQREREAWFERQLMKKVGAQFAPMQQEFQTTKQAREYYERAAQADEFSKNEYAQAEKWPQFIENKAAIADVFSKMQFRTDDPREIGIGLRNAYIQVMSDQVFPTIHQTERSAAIGDLTRKAGANTVNPSSTTVTPPLDKTKTSWHADLKEALASSRG